MTNRDLNVGGNPEYSLVGGKLFVLKLIVKL